jgi:micrococcal nuclease
MYRIAVALIALCLVVLPVLSCGTANVFVIDGDTIRLSNGERVRYIGIDAPEKGEPYFEEATRANEQLVQNRSLSLETDVTNEDRYGRLLRYVFAEDILVNAELVRQGLALVYRRGKFPDEKYFDALRQAAEEAAAAGRGIWSLGLDHPKLLNSQEDYFLPSMTTDQLLE